MQSPALPASGQRRSRAHAQIIISAVRFKCVAFHVPFFHTGFQEPGTIAEPRTADHLISGRKCVAYLFTVFGPSSPRLPQGTQADRDYIALHVAEPVLCF